MGLFEIPASAEVTSPEKTSKTSTKVESKPDSEKISQLIWLASDSSHLLSKELITKLETKNLSASMVTGLEGCHTRWIFENLIASGVIEQTLDSPAQKGTIFHKVMEKFYSLPKEKRSKKTLGLAMKYVAKNIYPELRNYPDVQEWLKDAVKGYLKLENIDDVNIAEIKGKPGLEQFVSIVFPESSRKALGFVDRIDVLSDGKYRVVDYKSGAKAKHFKGKPGPGVEGWPEQRQQIFYAMLMENQGLQVESSELYYPLARERVPAILDDKNLRTQVKKDFEKTESMVDTLAATNEIGYSPDFLCVWCPLAKVCPQATTPRGGKPAAAYESQPDPHELEDFVKIG